MSPIAKAPVCAAADDRAVFAGIYTVLWLMLAGVTVLGLAGLPLGGVAVDPASFRTLNVVVGVPCAVVGIVYTYWRYDEVVAVVASTVALLALSIPMLCMTSYVAGILSAPFPLADTALDAMDRGLGFHWPQMVAFFNAHPVLGKLGRFAYESIQYQAGIMALALLATRQFRRLQLVFVVFFVGCLLCQAISIATPARGAYALLGFTAENFAGYNPGLADPTTIDALRAGTFPLFGPHNADGIITFPSFHAALAVLFMWAFWRTPWLRWPALALNVAMILSTPPLGAHYLIDVIAGIGVGLVAVKIATVLPRLLAGASRSPTVAPQTIPA